MNSLAGTSWYCRDNGTLIIFTDKSAGRVMDVSGVYFFSYTCSPSDVLFSFSPGYDDEAIPGTIDGNLLIVLDERYLKIENCTLP